MVMVVQYTCGLDNSFRDLVVHQLVIHGMRDQDIRKRSAARYYTRSSLCT
jgi:hypothetical protein